MNTHIFNGTLVQIQKIMLDNAIELDSSELFDNVASEGDFDDETILNFLVLFKLMQILYKW